MDWTLDLDQDLDLDLGPDLELDKNHLYNSRLGFRVTFWMRLGFRVSFYFSAYEKNTWFLQKSYPKTTPPPNSKPKTQATYIVKLDIKKSSL